MKKIKLRDLRDLQALIYRDIDQRSCAALREFVDYYNKMLANLKKDKALLFPDELAPLQDPISDSYSLAVNPSSQDYCKMRELALMVGKTINRIKHD